MIRTAALAVIASLAVYGVYAFAQERAQMRAAVTSVIPISSSSASDASFAWFYDPANRTVYACRAVGASPTVECKGRAELP